jgi:hypothetical protein
MWTYQEASGCGRQASSSTKSILESINVGKTWRRETHPFKSSPRSTLSDSEENCQDRRVQRIRTVGTNKRISTPPTTVVTRWAISSACTGQAEIEQIHISSFGTHADVAGEGRLIVAVGDATFASTGSGESVPYDGAERGWCCSPTKFDTVDVGEHNTTQARSVTRSHQCVTV